MARTNGTNPLSADPMLSPRTMTPINPPSMRRLIINIFLDTTAILATIPDESNQAVPPRHPQAGATGGHTDWNPPGAPDRPPRRGSGATFPIRPLPVQRPRPGPLTL